MQSAVTHRWLDHLTLAFVILLLAVPLTLLEVARPSWQSIRDTAQSFDTRFHNFGNVAPSPQANPKAVAKPKAATTPKPSAAVAAAPAPLPVPAVAPNTATTNSFVHLRAAKSVASAILTDLNAGTVVQLRDDADATWQGVTYQGKIGYIYRAYLQYQPTTTTPK